VFVCARVGVCVCICVCGCVCTRVVCVYIHVSLYVSVSVSVSFCEGERGREVIERNKEERKRACAHVRDRKRVCVCE